MKIRTVALVLVTCLISTAGFSQSSEPYQVPRTEYGQPDFQGAWGAVFNTMLERPGEMPLILSPEQAAGFAAVVSQNLGDNNDPDVDRFGPPTLAKVNGEFRSSVVVYPEDGVLPYNELGTQMSSYDYFKGDSGFDHPEERPGTERCIEAWGSPPMRAFMYQLFHGFVQTEDKIAIVSEEAVALRVIHMDGYIRPDAIRSFEGHSIGHWEGDTLVVETTHYSDVNPARATIGRPMLISSAARVTERFTRTSETELNYQYTVDDPTYYTEPWKGEFSFTRDASGHIYEYACHEGNYSMVGALRGARAQEAQAAQKEATAN
ncbi:MAG: hypothetical protein COB20_04000 [SAR86 cluster bacterium]|uniref:Uncharacterized protein n=1 Tax=SAR86 cluster bacterium TaxID=2030880 RepID=A0A2A4XB95_9GAMM|nr:MAG: hypothetical protein COB20_04000 [SAR86 cluster bacterium]